MRLVRRAAHAGSWYTAEEERLRADLDSWLDDATRVSGNPAKAIIGPHAGLAYCGATAAWSWKQFDPTSIRRVILMGPSHRVYLKRCALPSEAVVSYETPLGGIPLDTQTIGELRKTGCFEEFALADDEDEHSLEMQLPYLRRVFEDEHRRCTVSIVPIVVGRIEKSVDVFARHLVKFLDDAATVFVVSSDFCHWGSRFRYTHLPGDVTKSINGRIEALDREGLNAIETQNPEKFSDYLEETGNTICGRAPILLFLQILGISGKTSRYTTKCLKYSQSSAKIGPHGSSVSYAAVATSPV